MKDYFWSVYRVLVRVMFLCFLGGTLTSGRSFSVLKLFEVSGLPFYITDVFILLALPLAVEGLLNLKRHTLWFWWPYVLLLILGGLYLYWGVCVDRSPFAFRGVILSSYLLFLPLVGKVVPRAMDPGKIFMFLSFCNVLGTLLGGVLVFFPRLFQGGWGGALFHNARGSNLVVYYGIAVAFLLAYSLENVRRVRCFTALFLVALNLYLIMVMGVRSAWVGVVVLIILVGILWRSDIKKVLMNFIFAAFFFMVIGFFLHIEPACIQSMSMRYVGTEKPDIQKGSMSLEAENIMPKGIVPPHSLSKKADIHEQPTSLKSEKMIPAIVAPQQSEFKNPDIRPVPISLASEKMAGLRSFLVQQTTGKTDQGRLSPLASESYNNITWRLKIWKETLREGCEAFIWGNGFSRVPDYASRMGVAPVVGFKANSGLTPPHNEFLTVFFRMGLLGLGLFLWINLFVFVRGLRDFFSCPTGIRRACLGGALGALVYWHVMAMFFDVIDSPSTNIILWILLGFILVCVDKE